MIDRIRLYDLLKESFLLLDFADRQFLEQFDLTVSRYYVLAHIAAVPGLSPSPLSRYMFCDKSNITRLIHSLESDGLVERRPHEYDGRAQRLYLTAAGAALYQKASLAHQQFILERLAVLEEHTAANFAGILVSLNRALSDSLDSSPSILLN
jgi:DNA-binding MarR family transcriptional regulator